MRGSKYAHQLWYQAPATCWNEALPIGNGRIGGMLYGGATEEQIDLNEDTLWSGAPYCPTGEYSEYYRLAQAACLEGRPKEAQTLLEDHFGDALVQMYLPLGSLFMNMEHTSEIRDYSRCLDLETATHTVQYKVDDITYTRKTIASVPQQVIAMQITADKKASISLSVSLRGAMSFCRDGQLEGKENLLYIEGNCPVCKAPFGSAYSTPEDQIYGETDSEKGVGYRGAILADTLGGTTMLAADESGKTKIVVSDADQVVIYFAVRTSFNGPFLHPVLQGKEYKNVCIQDLQLASAVGFQTILNEAVQEHQRLYNRTELDLGENEISSYPTDKRLALHQEGQDDPALYALVLHFGRYLTISASRKGTQPMNLQGIWNNQLLPPWSSNYTLNINTEMNYWPTLAFGLSECYEPFLHFVEEMHQSGERTAKQFYNAKGFVSHHASDLWRTTHPTTHQLPGNCQWGFWNMSSGWLAWMGMNYYRHTKDRAFLDKYFPILLDAGEFYRSLLIEKNGHLILSPSTSPENNYMLATEDGEVSCPLDVTTTMTTAILRDVFAAIVEAGEILGYEVDCYRELIDKLMPYSIASDGTMNEWYEEHKEWDIHHRHVSHLYGLFPSDQLASDKPELMEACKKTLMKRQDESSGWSIAWKVNLWARLGDGNHALKVLDRYLVSVEKDAGQSCKGGVFTNMFCAHPPFQIDGNFGVCSGILEMLVRHTRNGLELLPALPDTWKNGALYGYHVSEDDAIDVIWKDGRLCPTERRDRIHL